MVAWTAFTGWAYLERARRRPPLLLADLAVAVALIAVAPVVKGAGFSATIPGFWVMGALLAWAVHWRWVGGLVAGVVLSVVDLWVRQDVAQVNYANAFLLVLGGTIVGFLVESLQLMAAERDRAQRSAAAAVERARLARAVHDGVLQVLALVQRRGAELGGEAAELGRLGGEQEVALRTLIRAEDVVVSTPDQAMVDLAAALSALGTRPGVHVATPAPPSRSRGSWPPSWRRPSGPAWTTCGRTSAPTRRPGCSSRRSRTGSRCPCATTGPGSRPVVSRRPTARAGSASWSPSGVGCATWAGRPRCTPVPAAPSGSWSRPSNPSEERSRDHPHLAPVRRPRARRPPAVPGPAGRRGEPVDRRAPGDSRAGLTVTSLMLAHGERAHVLALLDPDSDLAGALEATGAAVVQLLRWADRGLAETFAGTAPAPGGLFRQADFVDTEWGPRLAHVTTWAGVRLVDTTEVGWSLLVTCAVEQVVVGADHDPLGHRRGRFVRLPGPG